MKTLTLIISSDNHTEGRINGKTIFKGKTGVRLITDLKGTVIKEIPIL